MNNTTSTARALLFCVLAACPPGPARAGASYYVSRSAGSDRLDGRAPVRSGQHGPWQTLAHASAATYAPGDQLLLRAGDTWRGSLVLHGSGTAAAPVLVTAYGNGARPAIHAASVDDACIVLDRCGGWRLEGLEMAHGRNAVRIVVDSRTRPNYDMFAIDDCYFHDIENPTFPDVAKREGSQHMHLHRMGWAIFVDGVDSTAPVHLSHVTVRHCVALWCQGFYIHVMGPVSADHVTFDANTLSHISYNAIYQASASDFDITNSVLVYGYPWAFHPNGATQVLAGGLIGNASSRNTVAGNEFGWGGDYPGCPDGCAYDFEGATDGVAFQHNYLHDTSGEPVLFMGGFAHHDLLFDANILRDNVRFSTRWDSNVTTTTSNTGAATFRNNRFYLLPGKRAFMQRSPAYTYADNDESAKTETVAMPLVTRMSHGRSTRTYTLACSTPGSTIRYTLDGSLPTAASPAYKRPIAVARTCALNAKAFRAGYLDSYVNSLVVDLRDAEARGPVARMLGVPGTVLSDIARSRLERVSDAFTVAFWVSPSAERESHKETNTGVADETGRQLALGAVARGSASDAGIAVAVGTNGVSVYESAEGYRPCMLNDDRALSGWRHITIVYREKQPMLYLDGVFEKAGCKSTRTVRPIFDLASPSRFSGTIRDVRVYDRLLTEAEIQALAARK